MKKIILFFACIMIVCITLSSCTTYEDVVVIDGVSYYYSEFFKEAFVGDVRYDKDGETDIVIPDMCNGHKVTSLGGYYGMGVPTPFVLSVDVTELVSGASESTTYLLKEQDLYSDHFEDRKVIVEDIKVHITLPNSLEEVMLECDCVYCTEMTDENGQNTVYVFRPVYYFEMEENDLFRTDEGKLYDKTLGEYVQNITYDEYVANK